MEEEKENRQKRRLNLSGVGESIAGEHDQDTWY